MQPLDLEPELEELLLRLVPGLEQRWQGATPDEIDRVEHIAGRPLPRFYRWFLTRMGHGMGSIDYPRLDFSAPRVLACYREKLFLPHPRFLMIGYETSEQMPLHVLYDFDHPARDDARVTKRYPMGGALYDQFDTFREMLAWGVVWDHGVEPRPQRCVGMFSDSGGDVLSHLDPVMKSLGFEAPIPTGRCCSVYHRADASMITHSPAGDEPKHHATQTSLELEIDRWEPELPV
jgi:hypothetical protein